MLTVKTSDDLHGFRIPNINQRLWKISAVNIPNGREKIVLTISSFDMERREGGEGHWESEGKGWGM